MTTYQVPCPCCAVCTTVTVRKYYLFTSYVCGVCNTALEVYAQPNTGLSVAKTEQDRFSTTESSGWAEMYYQEESTTQPVDYKEHVRWLLEEAEYRQDYEACAKYRDILNGNAE